MWRLVQPRIDSWVYDELMNNTYDKLFNDLKKLIFSYITIYSVITTWIIELVIILIGLHNTYFIPIYKQKLVNESWCIQFKFLKMSHQMPHGHLCTVSVRHVSIKLTFGCFNGPKGFFKKQNFLRGWRTDVFFTRTKIQPRHICRDLWHILAHIQKQFWVRLSEQHKLKRINFT